MATISTWLHGDVRYGRAGFFLETQHGRISVQFGAGNYCDNYDAPMSQLAAGIAFLQPSTTCEVWGSMFPGDPVGRVPVARVMRFCADVLAAETQQQAEALGAALDEEMSR